MGGGVVLQNGVAHSVGELAKSNRRIGRDVALGLRPRLLVNGGADGLGQRGGRETGAGAGDQRQSKKRGHENLKGERQAAVDTYRAIRAKLNPAAQPPDFCTIKLAVLPMAVEMPVAELTLPPVTVVVVETPPPLAWVLEARTTPLQVTQA